MAIPVMPSELEPVVDPNTGRIKPRWHKFLQGGFAPQTGGVAPSRQVATDGLATGGGDLSADRTITVTKASSAQALVGSDDATAMTPLRVAESRKQLMIVCDEKATGDGGSSIAGTQTRTLNTVVHNNIASASLASNEVSLPAGQYRARWSCPGYVCGHHQATLRNLTDSSDVGLGTAEYSASATQSRSHGFVPFTLAASKALSLRHTTTTATATNGLGVGTSGGGTGPFRFSLLEIERMSD